MGRKASSGGVRPRGDRIEVRFTFNGKQVSPTLALKPTAANLKHAARVRATVVEQIRLGTFTFAEHFPDYQNAEKHQPPSEGAGRIFKEWVEVWKRVAARTLEHSTLTIYARHLDAYWVPVFGKMRPEHITRLMILERLAALSQPRMDLETGKRYKALSRKTQNNILIPLRGVFDLICSPPSTLRNPCDGIENQRTQKPQPDPFAPAEVEVILQALRQRSGEVIADYFEFSFFSGLRASEHIALRWEDVDLRASTVRIHRARVLTKDKDRTKTNVERVVELNHRAAAVIQRQRARTQTRGQEVFINPNTDAPYVDEQTQRRAWQFALRSAGVRYRAPKECRDTSVTMALMAGANPMWVAMQHGHSVQVMLKDYAKWVPSADRGSNLAAVNASLGAPEAPRKAI